MYVTDAQVKKGHVAYCIQFQGSKVWKRYSELAVFHDLLSKECPPVPEFPPKSYFVAFDNPGLIDRRKKQLNDYFMALTKLPAGKSPLFYSSLGISPHSKPELDFQTWFPFYNKTADMIRSVRESIVQDKQSSILKNQVTRQVSTIQSRIQQLGSLLSHSEKQFITEEELLRRRNLLQSLDKEAMDLQSLWASRPHKDTPNIIADKNREELIGKPVFVRPSAQLQELDNRQLIENQQALIQQQDDALDTLLSVVQRQKAIGKAIGEELDIQNTLLEDLDAKVDVTGHSMKNVQSKLQRLT
jgi:regulator of vacuolar morphogenesis